MQTQTEALAPLPIIPMARFRRLMLGHGLNVDLPRLCEDSHYAARCLAQAHGSTDPALRAAAQALFAAYDAQPPARNAVH